MAGNSLSAAVIIGSNPCRSSRQGAAGCIPESFLASDPVSAFGGVLAFNRVVDAAAAEEVAKLLGWLPPGFDEEKAKDRD